MSCEFMIFQNLGANILMNLDLTGNRAHHFIYQPAINFTFCHLTDAQNG